VSINLHDKSKELLSLLANSIVDRDPNKKDAIYFSVNEINVVQQFLYDLILNKDSCTRK
jgi:hypothetical protein